MLPKLCAIAIREGLECPKVARIYIYKPPARVRGNWIKIVEEAYIEPNSESIAVGEGTIDMLVFRLTAGYMALAMYRSYGVVSIERAVEIARKKYFGLLVG